MTDAEVIKRKIEPSSCTFRWDNGKFNQSSESNGQCEMQEYRLQEDFFRESYLRETPVEVQIPGRESVW